jgi:type IV secretion system protein TrbL
MLAVVTPIAAAGLVGEASRAWFWKSLRSFIAAALVSVSMVLVLGIVVQITAVIVNGLTDKTEQCDRHRTTGRDLDPHSFRPRRPKSTPVI